MPETFESEQDDDLDLEEQEQEDEWVPPPRAARRKRGDDVPDGPVENAGDLPLLVHAGTSKSNTVTYLKVVRLDGPRKTRGLKGKLPPESTAEDVARRFGNGTYQIHGCNAKHKVLAREEGLEISIPGFDDDDGPAVVAPPGGAGGGTFGLHGMQMIARMSDRHGEVVRDQAVSMSEQVREMAARTMEMLTTFTSAQRDSERASHEAATANQQQFFATMMAMTTTAHAQQMEMLTAMHDRQRSSQVDPMAMIQVFIDGMKAAGELGGGGEGDEPWVKALKEGTGMMGHLAQLANAPAVAGRFGGAPQLPAQPNPRALPSAPQASNPASNGSPRKRRLPFKKGEIRELAQLKATLRGRGISFDEFLAQTREHIQQAPESELFPDDDGPDESEDSVARIQASPEDPSTE